MIPAAFEYLAPTALPEAITLLRQHGAEAKILAGGHSLIPLMKLRLAAPTYLIDITGIKGLDGIGETDGYLRIGALTREADLESSDLIRRRYPILLDATRVIADLLVRNLATVGGNLAHADPANDHPAVMPALEAGVVTQGADGERRIPIDQFSSIPSRRSSIQPR